ncbi:MAG: hypothetical protein KDE66_10950, partial [Nitrosomonas sp.]|nr:hypothetical protein [Nitrosomonas sp.]
KLNVNCAEEEDKNAINKPSKSSEISKQNAKYLVGIYRTGIFGLAGRLMKYYVELTNFLRYPL